MIKQQLSGLLKLTEADLKLNVILKQHPEEQALFFLILNKKANTFTPPFIREIHEALNKVEQNAGPTVLITTSFHPTIFSGGLDLNHVGALDTYDRPGFILEFIRLLGRMLSLSVPSIAMVNGHAVAGGCMLMFSHDWRIGRSETGKSRIYMNEIEIAMYLPPGMNAVCQCKLTPNTHRDLCLIAKRFDAGTEGVSSGILESVHSEDKILEATIQKGIQVSKYGVDKENYHKIKCEMFKGAIDACFNQQMSAGVKFELGIPKL